MSDVSTIPATASSESTYQEPLSVPTIQTCGPGEYRTLYFYACSHCSPIERERHGALATEIRAQVYACRRCGQPRCRRCLQVIVTHTGEVLCICWVCFSYIGHSEREQYLSAVCKLKKTLAQTNRRAQNAEAELQRVIPMLLQLRETFNNLQQRFNEIKGQNPKK